MGGIGRHRFVGFAVALMLGSLVAIVLFEIMGWLARAPGSSSQRSSGPFTIAFVSPLAVSRPVRRKHLPQATLKAPAPPVFAAALRSARPAHRTGRRPLALDFALPPVLALTGPVVSGKSAYINWRRSLNDYFRRRDRKPTHFTVPVLPPRPPSVLDLPVRMRFSGGFEIDRVGDTCYAVSADTARNRPPGANTSQLQVWRAMLPLFAHKVSCEPGATRSLGQEILEQLRKHGYSKPPPGR